MEIIIRIIMNPLAEKFPEDAWKKSKGEVTCYWLKGAMWPRVVLHPTETDYSCDFVARNIPYYLLVFDTTCIWRFIMWFSYPFFQHVVFTVIGTVSVAGWGRQGKIPVWNTQRNAF